MLAKAQAARTAMIEAAQTMIEGLHWADFQSLVDLLFGRTGWQRVSRVGGTQKDIDLELWEPTTGARAFVQVKSQAGPAVLTDYIARCDEADGFEHMFFICHSPTGTLAAPDRPDIHIWTGAPLADMTIKAGLYDWLMQRVQ